jgi:hypothetical protein
MGARRLATTRSRARSGRGVLAVWRVDYSRFLGRGTRPPDYECGTVFFFPGDFRRTVPRPITAGVLTIIGGFFILLGGVIFALLGAVFAIFGVVSGIFLLGLLAGLLTIIMGFLMIVAPSGHTVWGVLAIVLAIVSLPVSFGGLVVGFLLTLIGGVLAVRWKRPAQPWIDGEGRRISPPAEK